MQTYSDSIRENDQHALPDVEVLHVSEKDTYAKDAFHSAEDGSFFGEGWYWWACFPGCLPSADPWGPYATEHDALKDVRDYAEPRVGTDTDVRDHRWGCVFSLTMTRSGKGKVIPYKLITTTREKTK